MSEFSLIQRFFTHAPKHTDLSVGDDAALITPTHGHQLAISTDMLVAGTHFFADAAPYDIGWKALAVNVSDMAAMGAQPKWATLALALPDANENWIDGFAQGFFACADAFHVDLIGGDTTKGPLNLCVTIFGETPQGKALRRDGAQVGDDIWVSGQLGSAAAGLAHLQGKITLSGDALQASLQALHRPVPRVALGLKLREIAHSCIDISDGLAADLGHILEASQVGATLYFAQIPHTLKIEHAERYVLSGGDDYELCFTAPPHQREHIEKIAAELQLPLSRIGNIHAGAGLTVLDAHGNALSLVKSGYDHFA